MTEKLFDIIALWGSRPSGWMVVVPLMTKIITSRDVSLKNIHHWTAFGIPSIVKTDQGNHFTAFCRTTICASLGTQQIYSQAYEYASNGRADKAAQQIMQILRRVALESE